MTLQEPKKPAIMTCSPYFAKRPMILTLVTFLTLLTSTLSLLTIHPSIKAHVTSTCAKSQTWRRGAVVGSTNLPDSSPVFHNDSLMQMDVVIISEHKESEVKKLAAVQEDGRLALLSVWTTEPVFGDSLEFLVAEEDLFPGFDPAEVILHSIIPEHALSYGSRQVGGGKNNRIHVFRNFFR